ncbi:MAG TPA: hypothetical protein VD860_00815 [Azospirillum sp.]|nr:hypothetical protein [Azospirillum sp.]
MGKVERQLVTPFPTMRVRDCLRVTAVLELSCRECWYAEPLDVIALACRCHYLDQRVIFATESMSCSRCGAKGCHFRVVAGPGLMMIDLRFDHVIEPACRIVAHCRACHRSRDLDALDLGRNRAVRPDARLSDLQDRLRCEGCGQRGWTRIQLEW